MGANHIAELSRVRSLNRRCESVMGCRVNRFSFVLGFGLLSVALALSAVGQVPGGENKEFARDGLSLSYPADWTLTDQSNPQQQYLAFTRGEATLVIAVMASRALVNNVDQFARAKQKITEPYIRSLTESFGTAAHPATSNAHCLEVALHHEVEGIQIRGIYRNEPSTAEVYSFVKGGRFLTLVYIRGEKAGASGDIAWDSLRQSLRVNDPGVALPAEPALADLIDSGALKVVNMPSPDYPTNAMGTKPSGTVVVQVTIGETGAVTATSVVSGPPILMLAAVKAANQARFSPPLLCGQPVRITGYVVYRFTGPKMQN